MKNAFSQLDYLVARRKGILVHYPGTSCITVRLPHGCFHATGSGMSLEDAIKSCVDFVTGCRIGAVAPYLRRGPANLGAIVSAAIALRKSYEVGEEMSALVDGGEFGNIWVTYDRDMAELLTSFGTTRDEVNEAVADRCRLGYSLYSYLHI